MAYANDTLAHAGTLTERLRTFRAALADRVARYRLYRQTHDELAALSDRDLSDLGLSRADIADVATEAAYNR